MLPPTPPCIADECHDGGIELSHGDDGIGSPFLFYVLLWSHFFGVVFPFSSPTVDAESILDPFLHLGSASSGSRLTSRQMRLSLLDFHGVPLLIPFALALNMHNDISLRVFVVEENWMRSMFIIWTVILSILEHLPPFVGLCLFRPFKLWCRTYSVILHTPNVSGYVAYSFLFGL